MMQQKIRDTIRIAAAAALLTAGAGAVNADTTLYTSSNLADGNSVLIFEQTDNGTLGLVAEYPTGGQGTGGGLGNQGAIAHEGEYLFVVNAGSSEISSLRITEQGLELVSIVSSGGERPVSVTVDRGIVYVVNAGSDNIAGFTVADGGYLSPIAGSSQPLSTSGTGPAQISFTRDGRVLVVTEKATNRIVTYPVDRSGIAGAPNAVDSPGMTPFGFAVTKGRRILVSEAAGGAPGLSSVTAWKVAPTGGLKLLDPTEPTLQTAACWVAVTPNGRFAYTTNTGSGNVSAYRVEGDNLTLLDSDGNAGSTGPGSAPIDMAVTRDGSYLHVLDVANDAIVTFGIANDGSLTAVGSIAGLPDRATGLLAL